MGDNDRPQESEVDPKGYEGPGVPLTPLRAVAGVAVIGVAVCGARAPEPAVSAGAGVAVKPLPLGGLAKDVNR